MYLARVAPMIGANGSYNFSGVSQLAQARPTCSYTARLRVSRIKVPTPRQKSRELLSYSSLLEGARGKLVQMPTGAGEDVEILEPNKAEAEESDAQDDIFQGDRGYEMVEISSNEEDPDSDDAASSNDFWDGGYVPGVGRGA